MLSTLKLGRKRDLIVPGQQNLSLLLQSQPILNLKLISFEVNLTSKDAPDLHLLSSESNVVSSGQVLRHRLVLVLEPARGSGLNDLHVNTVAKFVLVTEVGGGRAGVQEVLGGVLPGHVGEPEVAFGVYGQPGRVDRLQPVLSLQHPVDGRVGPAVR